jgi:hypothetical protein
MVLSKVWDDLSMWNAADFFGGLSLLAIEFTLQRINGLSAILSTLKFIVKVPASEYAKYYFYSGPWSGRWFGGDDLKADHWM